MRYNAGPFIVEPITDNFLTGYRIWLPENPEVVHEFGSSREMGEYFEQICADAMKSMIDQAHANIPHKPEDSK